MSNNQHDEDIIEIRPKDFPSLLNEINDPPKYLYMRGELPPSDYLLLAVVGSRKFSTYGKTCCEILIESLRGQKVAIVSGLALGIDSIAHHKALEIGLKTIAIPGSGLNQNVIYPSLHRNLANKIVDSGGALISEFEPDFRATPYSFPQRNRIMAGISSAVLLIEAEEKSGTLITARLAMEYNRDVLVVPGSIFSASSRGTNALIKVGARPIISGGDLLNALGFEEVKSEDKYNDCSDNELKILKILLANPKRKDELLRESGLSSKDAQVTLSVLEIKGIIKETMGEIRLTNT